MVISFRSQHGSLKDCSRKEKSMECWGSESVWYRWRKEAAECEDTPGDTNKHRMELWAWEVGPCTPPKHENTWAGVTASHWLHLPKLLLPEQRVLTKPLLVFTRFLAFDSQDMLYASSSKQTSSGQKIPSRSQSIL